MTRCDPLQVRDGYALLIFLNLIDGFMKSSLETTLNKLEYELNQGILTISIFHQKRVLVLS